MLEVATPKAGPSPSTPNLAKPEDSKFKAPFNETFVVLQLHPEYREPAASPQMQQNRY